MLGACMAAAKPKKARCCVGGCNIDDRYPTKYVVRSHVKEIRFFKFTQAKDKRQKWIDAIAPALSGHFSPGNGTFVCANHFAEGEPTRDNPNPKLYLSVLQSFNKTPKKRRVLEKETSTSKDSFFENIHVSLDVEPLPEEVDIDPEADGPDDTHIDHNCEVRPDLTFDQVAREGIVRTYTGFINAETFRCVLDYLRQKAKNMIYWKGTSESLKKPKAATMQRLSLFLQWFEDAGIEPPNVKKGPPRKL